MGELDTITFGGSPDAADNLLALVLDGRKTATCWAAKWGVRTHVGKQVLACDSSGRPRAVLETLSLTRRRFRDLDEDWAAAEGEGDQTLAHWRQVHRCHFEAEGTFSEDMELWCERFRVVAVL